MQGHEQIIDEPLPTELGGKTAQLGWYPVVPGTVRLKFGPTTVRDDANGQFHWHNKHFGSIHYESGKVKFDHPITGEVLTSYDYDADAAEKDVKRVTMTIKSTPIKAKVRKLKWKPKPPTGPDPILVDQYRNALGTSYNNGGAHAAGYLSVPVLEFLWGRKLDQVVMAYIYGLRPSSVRIVTDTMKANCSLWRVTVCVDKKDFVERITQEVEVLLPEGVQHGSGLKMAMLHGIDSPQVKWDHDAESYAFMFGDYFKTTKDGRNVKWRFRSKRNRKLWRTAKQK